ncbi:hypothetical protein GOL41_26365 [Sinorhizobium medicae]|uniref:hypothetical protein n=1 Tax=Sinorhizobium medicae TaxID=110321 RepID=UPI0011A08AEE|nr:hypothetical protein [Sinorhizobium medicae]MDX0512573.1 hypothetical protein [Sinorhizobium medicae]MDX0870579.1 hypothetical protein [Sinorhizobium medicae]MDX0925372.1 hypothetical protein [Sinorhizobium medicae]MDX0937299.1 hypothetical protein [Sinorhizobium medicae]MDX0943539.1 hypothetical protein [Sinorhizobium medicae]
MAVYTNQPTLEANFIGPVKTIYDVTGSSIDGGRNGVGEGQTIEMSGGGIVTATYEDCKIKNPEHYEYVNWLGARLNGGFRFINVPIITDWFGPFPTVNNLPAPIVSGITHSDGSYFSDGAGYSQATVYGEITEAAALNAGIIKMRVYGLDRPLRWSDWFSIHHTTKGWRAYRYWQVISKTSEGNPVYTLALAPPLREAVSVGTRVEFARPRFVAKFKSDFTLPSVVEAFFVTQQSIQFVEAF